MHFKFIQSRTTVGSVVDVDGGRRRCVIRILQLSIEVLLKKLAQYCTVTIIFAIHTSVEKADLLTLLSYDSLTSKQGGVTAIGSETCTNAALECVAFLDFVFPFSSKAELSTESLKLLLSYKILINFSKWFNIFKISNYQKIQIFTFSLTPFKSFETTAFKTTE